MGDLFRITTQFLHVFAGVLWIGGGFYTLLVQLPGLMAAPPAARGPVSAQLAPRQIFYILRVAELTLVTGVLNLFASGRAEQFKDPLGQRWTIVLGLGILMAFGLYIGNKVHLDITSQGMLKVVGALLVVSGAMLFLKVAI